MNYYREFDHNGLLLAEYQAKIFEKSVSKFTCSSPIFLRRFVKSDLLNRLDENESSLIDMNVNMALQDIENQFGKSNYGKIKYSEEIMFWMGYIYRYISYTRDISTKIIFKYFKPKI